MTLQHDESKRLLVEALTYANDKYYLAQARDLRRLESAREQLWRLIDLSVPGLLPDFERSCRAAVHLYAELAAALAPAAG